MLLIVGLGFQSPLWAQQPVAPATNSVPGTSEEQLVALQLEMTNAWQHVLKIVNQPVQPYARTAGLHVGLFSPGWFHDGASKPDFNTVDVRQSQELIYAKNQYVTSDLNPGMVFLGRDLEFNSMTKYFYTDRSRPKHKLTEAEMLEINRLYRIIGRCESEIARLQAPAADEAQSSSSGMDTSHGAVEAIARIPREKRLLYGGIAIGVLIVLVVALRLVRKKSG